MAKTVSFRNQKHSFYGAVFQIRFNQERVKNQKTMIKTYNENKNNNKQAYKHVKTKTLQMQAESGTSYRRQTCSAFSGLYFNI